MTTPAPRSLVVGEHVLFTDPAHPTRYLLGTIETVLEYGPGGPSGGSSNSNNNNVSLRFSRQHSHTAGGGGEAAAAVYAVQPKLLCTTIASKKTAGRRLARATAYGSQAAAGAPPRPPSSSHVGRASGGGPEVETAMLLQRKDIADLNERRLQLQADVDTSRARVEEIGLFLEAARERRTTQRQRSAEATAAAKRDVLLAKASVRAARPEEWEKLLNAFHDTAGPERSRVLAAVVGAVMGLVAAPQQCSAEELESRVIAATVPRVAQRQRKAVRAAEACLKDYPPRSVPAEQGLLVNLYRWLQAIVTAVAAHEAQEQEHQQVERGPSSAHQDNADGRKDDDGDDGTIARLTEERRDHEEYLSVALEELTAMDRLIHEAKVALVSAGLFLRVPASYIAGPLTDSRDLREMAAAGLKSAAGSAVRLNVKVGNEIVALIAADQQRPRPRPRTTPSPSPPQPSLLMQRGPRSGRGRSRQSSRSKPTTHSKSASPLDREASSIVVVSPMTSVRNASRSGSVRRGSGAGIAAHSRTASLPQIPPLMLSRMSSSAGVAGSGEDGLEHTLRERFEKIQSSPRLPTPRMGAPLLEGSPPLSGRGASSVYFAPDTDDGEGGGGGEGRWGRSSSGIHHHSHNNNSSPVNDSVGLPAQERLQYQQALSELETRLERALQANPKEAEFQLLRDELSGTRKDLRRVKEERDKLLLDRRDHSQFSVFNRRAQQQQQQQQSKRSQRQRRSDGADDEDDDGNDGSSSDGGSSRAYGDHVVIEELEEQLNAAHRRIWQLEHDARQKQQQQAQLQQSLIMEMSGIRGGFSSGGGGGGGGTDPMGMVSRASFPQTSYASPSPGAADGGVNGDKSVLGGGGGDFLNDASSQLTLSRDASAAMDHRDGGMSPSPAPDLIAAAQQQQQQQQQKERHVQLLLSQLGEEQRARQQLQAKMDAIQQEYDLSKRNSGALEERLNLALHAREQSQAVVDQQRRELDVMWARLEEAEAQLHEEQERASVARQLQEEGEMGTFVDGLGMMSLPSVLGALHAEKSVTAGGGTSVQGAAAELPSLGTGLADAPSVLLRANHAANSCENNNSVNGRSATALQATSHYVSGSDPLAAPDDDDDNNTMNGSSGRGNYALNHNVGNNRGGVDGGEVSRASSPSAGATTMGAATAVAARDASASPQPILSGAISGISGPLAGASAAARAVSTRPVEGMSAVELRHELRLMREEVERLQSVELRLSTELNGVRDKQREERWRRQQARNVRIQMLNRLQDAVQQAMATKEDDTALSDLISRTREETAAILANRTRQP